jgi:N6-adenosine-specific RNA methylase IME4
VIVRFVVYHLSHCQKENGAPDSAGQDKDQAELRSPAKKHGFQACSGATNAEAIDIIRTWGFEFKTIALVWVKTNPLAKVVTLDGKGLHWGMGWYTRANAEVLLLATRGKPRRLANDVHQIVIAAVGDHSAKPGEPRRRIEQLYGGPHLELFGRRVTKGWTVWGNEVGREEFLQAAE